MKNYRFTAFDISGAVLFNEVWVFESDEVAKIEGQKKIEEKEATNTTHRLVNQIGKLIIFHA